MTAHGIRLKHIICSELEQCNIVYVSLDSMIIQLILLYFPRIHGMVP